MPKIGMEPLRRRALIDATISAIGERGSLDVTMSDIAGRAGVSSALAHHYFGAKDDLLEATMRRLLADLGRDRSCCAGAGEHAARAGFGGDCREFFRRAVSPGDGPRLARLLCRGAEVADAAPAAACLCRRLNSNLLSGLAPLLPRVEAERMAEAIAAMIDGLYIRRALKDGLPNPASAAALVEDFVETKLRAASPK